MNYDMTAEQLRAIREQLDLSQKQMWELLGISYRAYQRYEAGHVPVPNVIAKALIFYRRLLRQTTAMRREINRRRSRNAGAANAAMRP